MFLHVSQWGLEVNFQQTAKADSVHLVGLAGKCTMSAHRAMNFVCWNLLAELDPTAPLGFSKRSAVYLQQRKYREALDDLDQAVTVDPVFLQGYLNRGRLLRQMCRYVRLASSSFYHDKSSCTITCQLLFVLDHPNSVSLCFSNKCRESGQIQRCRKGFPESLGAETRTHKCWERAGAVCAGSRRVGRSKRVLWCWGVWQGNEIIGESCVDVARVSPGFSSFYTSQRAHLE